ncbi:alpha/beta hydrolase [Candidatus Absconditicoccus praedator]|uniref:alpha/beta hydrolase n=1 Tax=Candidatus Absconditicoccus praedator TaxID=2735562 RepID=UPI001E3FC015|nr:alpha/beta fold hydrolase [Candidatus Absconditicoccus praedator]UFX83021.1 alpha/beta hydrolase [Candidatus Absconditicoccus praedator]
MKKVFGISFLSIFILAVISAFVLLYFFTGFLNGEKIDNRDLEHWEYTSDGKIKGAEEIKLEGENQTCWLMIHGYTSVPDEFKNYAKEINKTFGDYVYVPRLEGHGTKPSDMIDIDVKDWYNQVDDIYKKLENKCNNINIVGFSLGGFLSIAIAQNQYESTNNLYLLAPFIKLSYIEYDNFSLAEYAEVVGQHLVYGSKINIAQINKPGGEKEHIAYLNFPFEPITNSFDYFEQIRGSLGEVNIPTLIQHSKKDRTNNIQGSKLIYDNIASEYKKLIKLEKSNHVLMRDYEKNKVLENIIKFEKDNR